MKSKFMVIFSVFLLIAIAGVSLWYIFSQNYFGFPFEEEDQITRIQPGNDKTKDGWLAYEDEFNGYEISFEYPEQWSISNEELSWSQEGDYIVFQKEVVKDVDTDFYTSQEFDVFVISTDPVIRSYSPEPVEINTEDGDVRDSIQINDEIYQLTKYMFGEGGDGYVHVGGNYSVQLDNNLWLSALYEYSEVYISNQCEYENIKDCRCVSEPVIMPGCMPNEQVLGDSIGIYSTDLEEVFEVMETFEWAVI
ncbi:hypothetical protein KC717_01590 [Candidatus Dojkabacteria bacterium]|uniref:Uncharacterized protein n=1 Tax=Candidatus Dojkabacteria bacterium TaxID=2099670 RepID=A0A955L7X7_9BACT|nr:hypothetical protein [Candidatus Dojkabacteria bacterium]